TVDCGANQTFTVAADACYHIADVLVDGSSVGAVASYTFANVASDHTIAASFAIDTHVLSATAGDHGSITPGTVTVDCGSNQTFTVAADACYHIADVLVDGGSIGAVASYTSSNVTADHTIAASFAIDTHVLSATAGDHGSINPGTVTVDCGSNQT